MNDLSAIIFSIRKIPVIWVVFTFYHIIIINIAICIKILGRFFIPHPAMEGTGSLPKMPAGQIGIKLSASALALLNVMMLDSGLKSKKSAIFREVAIALICHKGV